jgi:hypothetical protein
MITFTALVALFSIICTIKIKQLKKKGRYTFDCGWVFLQYLSFGFLISIAIILILAYLP